MLIQRLHDPLRSWIHHNNIAMRAMRHEAMLAPRNRTTVRLMQFAREDARRERSRRRCHLHSRGSASGGRAHATASLLPPVRNASGERSNITQTRAACSTSTRRLVLREFDERNDQYRGAGRSGGEKTHLFAAPHRVQVCALMIHNRVLWIVERKFRSLWPLPTLSC